MSDKKSFWSSVPGVVTGVASILTAVVALLGISAKAGWIGGGGGDGGATVASSSEGATTTIAPAARGATPTSGGTAAGEFAVEPASATFEPLKPKEATVTVRNTGDVPLTMRAPTVDGSAAAAFKVADLTCTRSVLAPGRSCEVKVTFAPAGPGEYSAVLVVAASNAPRQVEVGLKGTQSLLG